MVGACLSNGLGKPFLRLGRKVLSGMRMLEIRLLSFRKILFRIFVKMNSDRKIIHIDMDAFFASVEQRDNPALRGLPLAVGNDGPRGVVATASYEARRYVVHSAQSMQIAHRLCPALTVVEPHFEKYKGVNAQISSIFHDYTDLVEFLSIDEAFLDVTVLKDGTTPLAVDVARTIKRRIREELDLTASAGVSYCKFLAKIASDYKKPDGLCVIHPRRAEAFLGDLPIEKFWGVGPKTAQRMHALNIHTGRQLRDFPLRELERFFGQAGKTFYNFARGIDVRPVVTEHETKSIGVERTFETDLHRPMSLVIEVYHLTLELLERLKKHSDFEGCTLTLKVKFDNFEQCTRSCTHVEGLRTKDQILPLAKMLLQRVESNRPVRLLGLTVSNPRPPVVKDRNAEEWVQLELSFADY